MIRQQWGVRVKGLGESFEAAPGKYSPPGGRLCSCAWYRTHLIITGRARFSIVTMQCRLFLEDIKVISILLHYPPWLPNIIDEKILATAWVDSGVLRHGHDQSARVICMGSKSQNWNLKTHIWPRRARPIGRQKFDESTLPVEGRLDAIQQTVPWREVPYRECPGESALERGYSSDF